MRAPPHVVLLLQFFIITEQARAIIFTLMFCISILYENGFLPNRSGDRAIFSCASASRWLVDPFALANFD